MKTRAVERFKAKDYLKRAQELKTSMNKAFDAEDWNSDVINAVHCAISSADTVCIFNKGIRNAEKIIKTQLFYF